MTYQKWEYRDGTVIVEKYTGELDLNTIRANDDAMFEAIQENVSRLLILIDLSKASLKNISFTDVEQIFSPILKYESITYGMKLALYVGLDDYEVFMKASKYAENDTRHPVSIIPFNFLETAMTWLGLSEAEQELITAQLVNQD